MSYSIANFNSQIAQTTRGHKWNPNRATELNAIAAALATDPSRYDTTVTAAPAALRPGLATHTKFTNDILLVVNRGKSGRLTPLSMGNAITAGLSKILPPVNTSVPAVSGTTTLTCTMGNWTYAPTGYAYQWMRGATPIGGATTNTYVVTPTDSGTSVSCRVTASNAAGSTSISSNAIAVP